MFELNGSMLKIKSPYMRMFPYLAVGGLIFYFNSANNFNYIVKGYLILLQAQLVILTFLWVTGKLTKNKKRHFE